MHKKINKGLLTLFILGIHMNMLSQQVYRIIKGEILITMKYKDSALVAKSSELVETIDYETSQIAFRVPYETLVTGVDSIDNKLRLLEGQELYFSGKINLTINMLNSSPQKFNIEGIINSAIPPVVAFGNGNLVCFNPGNNSTLPSCMLTLTMKSTLKILNLNQLFMNADDEIQIEILQSLLEKAKTN